MSRLVFLDVETSGLDPLVHDVVEIAWAVDGGPVRSYVPVHTLEHADPEALRINQYYERGLSSARHPGYYLAIELDFLRDIDGATIVGSNPAFDTAFLRRKLGRAPWHHRLIDISNVAMMVFGEDRPMGLKDIVGTLAFRGYIIPAPDHTAFGDVEATRAAYQALRRIGRPS
jgi:DNA polymerase-3 subunit epsilon